MTSEIETLSREARERRLASPAFAGATFTLWDAGAHGVTSAGMVINAPQACALAAGSVRETPVVRDGALVAARPMTLTLACDHRILYGERATGFLAAIKARLEEPDL